MPWNAGLSSNGTSCPRSAIYGYAWCGQIISEFSHSVRGVEASFYDADCPVNATEVEAGGMGQIGTNFQFATADNTLSTTDVESLALSFGQVANLDHPRPTSTGSASSGEGTYAHHSQIPRSAPRAAFRCEQSGHTRSFRRPPARRASPRPRNVTSVAPSPGGRSRTQPLTGPPRRPDGWPPRRGVRSIPFACDAPQAQPR